MVFIAVCFVMILTINSFVDFKRWVKIIAAWKNVSRSLQLIQRYFELTYEYILVVNPFMSSGNKRLNTLKQICSFLHLRKLNFRTHNDLQVSHIISIFVVFKKLSQKGSYKMMHFVLKTLKLLTLEFQFWNTLGGGGKCSPPRSPAATSLLLQA